MLRFLFFIIRNVGVSKVLLLKTYLEIKNRYITLGKFLKGGKRAKKCENPLAS